MASFEFRLPDIGEGVTEGEVVAWHVQEGDSVTEDQLMVEVMTDKATVTIGAPRAGKVLELRASVGAAIKVGEVLVVLHTGNGSRAVGGKPSKMPASAVGDIQESLPGASYFAQRRASEAQGGQTGQTAQTGHVGPAGQTAPGSAAARTVQPPKAPTPYYADKPLATPATRKLARDLGVDLRRVPPSGDRGRVTKQDLRDFAGQAASRTATGPAHAPSGAPPRLAPVASLGAGAPQALAGEDQRIPFVGMRRKIAERMRRSKDSAAHFTFVEECDAGRLMDLRNRLRPRAEAQRVQLTFLPFVVKAVVGALKRHPKLNASLDEARGEIVMHGGYHIGIAAATDQGLVVPVVRHADRMTLLQLSTEIERLGQAARSGQLTRDDMTGSTFTVTSLGKQAGLFAVPIINHPNVGILGIHRIKERPVVRDGQIVIGHEMLLSLSLDHRIVDGHEGAAFAYDVIDYLEDPASMLLDA